MSTDASHELQTFLINARTKDGLKRCETLLKKSPHDVVLLLYKCRFLRILDRDGEACACFSSIAAFSKPISPSNLARVEVYIHETQLDVYPRRLTSGPEAQRLWTQAIAAASRRVALQLHQERYASAVQDRRWQDASSALQVWRKAEPSNRGLKFTHIAVQMVLSRVDTDAQMATLNEMLALKTLEQTAPGSLAELRTAACVLSKQSKTRAALLKIYNDLEGSTLMRDWEFSRSRLQTLRGTEAWSELRTTCVALFQDTDPGNDASARARDDWFCWKSYIEACVVENITDEAEVISVLPKDNTRYLALAKVRLAHLIDAKQVPVTSDTHDACQVALSAALESYITLFLDKPYCFNDVRSAVEQLSPTAQDVLSRHATAQLHKQQPESEVEVARLAEKRANILKFKFLRLDCAKTDLEELLALCLHALDSNKTESDSAQRQSLDTIFVAISVLIKLFETKSENWYLCAATRLLEPLARRRVYPAQVLCVYLYNALGLRSLAAAHYETLNIREVQNESLCHALVTHMSISHPWEMKPNTKASFDIIQHIHGILKRLDDSEVRCHDLSASLPINERPDMLFELTDMRERLDKSITRRILLLEQRRAARLTDRALKVSPRVHPAVFESWVDGLVDSRDFQTSFDYASSQREHTSSHPKPTIERLLQQRSGGVPDRDWVHYHLFIDQIWSKIMGQKALLNGSSTVSIPALDVSRTHVEAMLLPSWILLSRCTDIMSSASSQQAVNEQTYAGVLKSLLTEVRRLQGQGSAQDQTKNADVIPDAVQFQTWYSQLDLLKAISAYHRSLSSAPPKTGPKPATVSTSLAKPSVDLLRDIDDVAKKLYASIQADARHARDRTTVDNLIAWIRACKSSEDDTRACAQMSSVRGLIADDGDWRIWAQSAIESARLSLDGVLRVKL